MRDVEICSINCMWLEREDLQILDEMLYGSKNAGNAISFRAKIRLRVPESTRYEPSSIEIMLHSIALSQTEYFHVPIWFNQNELSKIAFFADIIDRYKNSEAVTFVSGFEPEYFRESIYAWMLKENLTKGYDRSQAEVLSRFVADGGIKKYEGIKLESNPVVDLVRDGYCAPTIKENKILVNKIETVILSNEGALEKASITGIDNKLKANEKAYWKWLSNPDNFNGFIGKPPMIDYATKNIFADIFDEKDENLTIRF